MKTKQRIWMPCLLLAGMAVTASCSSDENEWMQEAAGNVLKIETSIAETRDVVTGTQFQEGDQIGLYVKTPDGHDYTGSSSNVAASYNGTQWNISQNIALRADEAAVYAYYPYHSAAISTGDSIDIDIAPIEGSGQPDYMYGSCAGVNLTNQTANIGFQHALARVTLAITKGSNDVGAGKISKVCLHNGPLYVKSSNGFILKGKGSYISTKGRMDLKSGKIKSVVDTEAEIEVATNCTASTTNVQYVDLLVMPCTTPLVTVNIIRGGNAFITLTIDGDSYSIDLGKPTWEAGQQYTYPITINRQTVHIEKVYMGIVGDDQKPLYWATCNLGASSPEEWGGTYGWGDPTGTHTEQYLGESWGNYVEDEATCRAFYGGLNPPTDISGTEYDVARALWGEGWRIPSKSEFDKLRDNCKRELTTLNGAKGYRFTSNLNGNSIFLPLTPSRWGEKLLEWELETAESGNYWTSTHMYPDYDLVYHIMLTKLDNNYGGRACTGYSIRPVTSE